MDKVLRYRVTVQDIKYIGNFPYQKVIQMSYKEDFLHTTYI